MDVRFFRCNICRNIAVKVVDEGPALSCCGQEMEELVADSTDAATEKHVPCVTREGNRLQVNVGSVDHPMLEEHYIQLICLVTTKDYHIHPLKPGDAPHAEFTVADDEQPLKVYEYCNIHGLWVKEL